MVAPRRGHRSLFRDGETKPFRQVETTTSGEFDFPWLRSGKYLCAVWGTARQIEGTGPIDLKLNARIDLKIRLHRRPPGPRGSVRVRVEDRLGIAIRGASVNVVLPSVHVAPRTTDGDGRAEFANLPVRADRVLAVASGYWMAGTLVAPGPIDEALDVTIVLEPTARVRVAVLDAATGKPLRHANVLVTHGGGDLWIVGGVLPRRDETPKDHHDVEVRPGPVRVHASSPGFSDAEASLDVGLEDDTADVTLRLAPQQR